MDQLETHLKFVHQSPPLIGRLLLMMFAVGFMGFFAKLFRASESNILFDGASLVLYVIGVGIYIGNIVKGLRFVSAEIWHDANFPGNLPPSAQNLKETDGHLILGREDSLKVMAASNTILALVLVGVLVLQAGQWYAERKDNEEYERAERAGEEEDKKDAAAAAAANNGGSTPTTEKKTLTTAAEKRANRKRQ